MIRIFVRHTVADFAAWKREYDEFEESRRTMGVVAHAVYSSVDNPNDITVWHDFDDLESARAFVESPTLRDAMTKAGVAGEPSIWFTKSV